MSAFAPLVLSALFVLSSAAHADPPAPVLKLDAHTGIAFNGATGQVTGWFDQSGNDYHASQNTAALAPIYVANGMNGQPVIRFNGTNQFFNVAGQVIHSQQFTIVAVVADTRSTTAPADFREVFTNWAGVNSTTSVFLGTTTPQAAGNRQVRFTDDLVNGGQITTPTTPFLLSAVSSASNAVVYKDAAQIGAKGSALSTRNLATAYAIGRQGELDAEYWQGDIGAIYVYDQALSAADLLTVQNDLGSRFGIAGFQPVPEPATVGLVAAGGLAVILRRRARRSH